MVNFFKQIFIWWNRQTIGTFLYTLMTGKFVGQDEFGNKYYTNKKKKRWAIYNDQVEASKIPPNWHSWIHFITEKKPNQEKEKFAWQKAHVENLTGTENAYKPEGSLALKSNKKNNKKYETWQN